MGNCIRHNSAMQWGGDDWGSMFSRNEYDVDVDDDDDVVVTRESKGRKRKGMRTEVKIMMNKKQLEELLKKLDVKDKVSVRQVISQLVRMSNRRRSWRPALRCIPEI